MVHIGVSEVDGAVFLVEVGSVLVLETDGGDGLFSVQFRG